MAEPDKAILLVPRLLWPAVGRFATLHAMALHLTLVYSSGAELRAYLVDQMSHGAVLLPVEGELSAVTQFDEVVLHISAGAMRAELGAQVLQVLPGTGIVLQLSEPRDLSLLAESATKAEAGDKEVTQAGTAAPRQPSSPPSVEIAAITAIRALDAMDEVDERQPWDAEDSQTTVSAARREQGENDLATGGADAGDGASTSPDEIPSGPDPSDKAASPLVHEPIIPAGSSPASWSLELLSTRWDELNLADRIRVARYGNRPARGLVLRCVDRSLHIHLLQNPGLTVEEVTIMAGMPNLDPVTLQRIASSVDWQKQASVAKALITNPKLPQTFVPKLLKNVPRDELSRLARTGKVRAAVKELIVKHLDRTR